MNKNEYIGTYKVVIAEVNDENFGACIRETWTNDDVVHKIGSPAIISRDPDTMNKIQEEWYQNGVLHRDGDEPARVFKNSTVTTLEWFEHGVHHRIGKPAIHETTSTGLISTEEWLLNGKHHRDGAPAIIWRNIITGITNLEDWCQNGKLHRLDGAAQIRRDDSTGIQTNEAWYKEGELFRSGGGAVFTDRDNITGEILKSQTLEQLELSNRSCNKFPEP